MNKTPLCVVFLAIPRLSYVSANIDSVLSLWSLRILGDPHMLSTWADIPLHNPSHVSNQCRQLYTCKHYRTFDDKNIHKIKIYTYAS